MLALLAPPAPTAATGQVPAPWVRPAGQTVAVFTHVVGIPGGGSLGEARLVQPMLMLDAGALGDHALFRATLDLEGWTIANGELSPGSWGEGFMDRRHPHTYVHEMVLTGDDLLGRFDGAARTALSVGKGFVPFGSDDPMSRPVLRFPVNHHIAQILERAMVAASVRAGPAELEAALFNGDEPERPAQWPKLDRWGDSWSARLTLRPMMGVEWQLSRAKVASPEHREGAGTPNHKWSTSLRWERPLGGIPAYALLEWARASEAGGFFVFHTLLFETQGAPGRHRVYYRFERTERPEEVRTTDLSRSVRPHIDNQNLGITRWTVHTIGYGLSFSATGGAIELRPFAEAAAALTKTVTGAFNPAIFYGRTEIVSLSVGLRAAWRMAGHRMGRYRDGAVHEPKTAGSHQH